MSIASLEAAPALAFSPACMACPNRTAACALNYDEVMRLLGEEITVAPRKRVKKMNKKEAN